jgi:hypothetical protein
LVTLCPVSVPPLCQLHSYVVARGLLPVKITFVGAGQGAEGFMLIVAAGLGCMLTDIVLDFVHPKKVVVIVTL